MKKQIRKLILSIFFPHLYFFFLSSTVFTLSLLGSLCCGEEQVVTVDRREPTERWDWDDHWDVVTSIRVTNKEVLKYKGITQHLLIPPPLSTGGRSVCVHPPRGGLQVPPALHTVPEEAGGRAGQQLRHQVRASDGARWEAKHAATCDSSSHATLRGGILLHRSALYPPSPGTNWSTRCACLRPGDEIRIE